MTPEQVKWMSDNLSVEISRECLRVENLLYPGVYTERTTAILMVSGTEVSRNSFLSCTKTPSLVLSEEQLQVLDRNIK